MKGSLIPHISASTHVYNMGLHEHTMCVVFHFTIIFYFRKGNILFLLFFIVIAAAIKLPTINPQQTKVDTIDTYLSTQYKQ